MTIPESEKKIVYRSVRDLRPADYNPRGLTDTEKEQLKTSIVTFGWTEPLVINKHPDRMDVIVGGHQRIKIAKELGIESVPTIEVCLTEDKERELNVRLNKNTGHWDWDLLKDLATSEDLQSWGFEEKELGKIFKESNDNIDDWDLSVQEPDPVWVMIRSTAEKIDELRCFLANVPDEIIQQIEFSDR
jgi:ParB-like chromosome segregation protein Spo0J